MGFVRRVGWALGLLGVMVATYAYAQDQSVTFGGVAYSGAASTLDQRFPYSRKYEKALKAGGESPYKRALSAFSTSTPTRFKLLASPIEELKGRDQALVTSLVINSETVSIERFGSIRKLFVLLRGEAIFFDFKSMTVVRSYPVSFGYIDNFNREPNEQEILDRVQMVFDGVGGKPGLYTRYAATLAGASIPTQTPRFLQVTKVNVAPEVLAIIPDYLKSAPSVYETWAADLVGEAIPTRAAVPIIPYSKGYAVGGVMSMQIMDGDVYNLTLPKPDYEIIFDIKGVRKVKYGEGAGGASYIYGTYADIRIQEPLSGSSYLNTALKNGEVKIVPMSQTYVDDFPAYYDSLNGMFVKLAEAIAGKGNEWVKSAAGAPDILAQINKTMELMRLCR